MLLNLLWSKAQIISRCECWPMYTCKHTDVCIPSHRYAPGCAHTCTIHVFVCIPLPCWYICAHSAVYIPGYVCTCSMCVHINCACMPNKHNTGCTHIHASCQHDSQSYRMGVPWQIPLHGVGGGWLYLFQNPAHSSVSFLFVFSLLPSSLPWCLSWQRSSCLPCSHYPQILIVTPWPGACSLTCCS